MSVLEATQDNFQSNVLDLKDKPVLVDFWATWCGPCQTQGPIIDELAGEIGDKAVIAKLDVDENQDIAGNYGVMSIPTLLIFKNGEVVEQLVGVHQKEALLKLIEKHS